MCGLCGLLGVSHWSEVSAHPEAFTGGQARTVRAERAHRAALVGAALAPFGMTVRDHEATSYIVATPTGRQEIVPDIQAVWGAVERLRGAPADPLDPDWLAALERLS
jgi:hypothetical protein